MANLDSPNGFEAVRMLNGDAPRRSNTTYTAKASIQIEPGSIVALEDGSTTVVLQATAANLATLIAAASFIGVAINGVTTSATDRAIHVWDLADTVFRAQFDGTPAADIIGAHCDPLCTTGTSHTIPYANSVLDSQMELQTTSISTTADTAKTFKILNLAPGSATGAAARYDVIFRLHSFLPASASVARS